MSRRRHDDLAPAAWPSLDDRALPTELERAFKSRREAIELYIRRTPIREIESRTGIARRQLYRLID